MSKLLIFSAPSGSGKSTLIRFLLTQNLNIQFSISATSRQPRGDEKDAVEYYFLSPDEFRQKIKNGEFLEYEEVYKVDRILAENKNVIFDVDCIGGLNIKKIYGDRALSIFVMPPSMQALQERLKKRGTDSPEVIKKRLEKAEYEISFAPQFDVIIQNDDYDRAKNETLEIISKFIEQ